MALYALDEERRIVFASDAKPEERYLCLECQGAVKKRTGRYRRAHFCHLRSAPQCRLHSKSIDHLVLQSALKQQIPELTIERPFPSILRIADLCWEKQRLVLEIQCSPITPREVENRRRDYEREGYSLVWLLDDRLFNKKRLRIAEVSLRCQTAYFFSLAKTRVYDQYELCHEESRVSKGPPLPIHLAEPIFAPEMNVPLQELGRRKGAYRFPGDLLSRILADPPYLQRLQEHEAQTLAGLRSKRKNWLKCAFYILLERLLRWATRPNT